VSSSVLRSRIFSMYCAFLSLHFSSAFSFTTGLSCSSRLKYRLQYCYISPPSALSCPKGSVNSSSYIL
jgi:hypothetical protein